jgi:hypothetical protein
LYFVNTLWRTNGAQFVKRKKKYAVCILYKRHIYWGFLEADYEARTRHLHLGKGRRCFLCLSVISVKTLYYAEYSVLASDSLCSFLAIFANLVEQKLNKSQQGY